MEWFEWYEFGLREVRRGGLYTFFLVVFGGLGFRCVLGGGDGERLAVSSSTCTFLSDFGEVRV